MISEIKVDVRNNKHEQTRKKKNVMKEPLSPSQMENKQRDIQESRPSASDHRASVMTTMTDSQNPATSKLGEFLMSPKMKTQPKPLDGVRAFLTELPPED
jgi:vesicle coat complex subunit